MAALLAGSLVFSGGLAQAEPDEPPPVPDISDVYKHKEASDSKDPVAALLILGLDTSGSMTDEEMAIEFQSTAYAVNTELFRNLIKYKSGEKSIALTVIDFDDSAQVRLGWVDIRGDEINDKPYKDCDSVQDIAEKALCLKDSSVTPDKLDRIANEIANLSRRGRGGTQIATAMDLAQQMFLAAPWKPLERRVLDIFGDGTSGYVPVEISRDELTALGVTINGFAIANEVSSLDGWYKQYVRSQEIIRGPDGIYSQEGQVWVVARDMKRSGNSKELKNVFYEEVAKGMRQKLSVEYAGVFEYFRALARLDMKPDFPLPEGLKPPAPKQG
ncbi:MAG: DUF1194 domain-containing protein [Rhodospirillales bacterium]|nr:DUF1194 domain-containing protein [Rhodospirillales bacterium]MCB9995906.1 DUF1194 domain-containing protein [Rhodospirillales bacterium]